MPRSKSSAGAAPTSARSRTTSASNWPAAPTSPRWSGRASARSPSKAARTKRRWHLPSRPAPGPTSSSRWTAACWPFQRSPSTSRTRRTCATARPSTSARATHASDGVEARAYAEDGSLIGIIRFDAPGTMWRPRKIFALTESALLSPFPPPFPPFSPFSSHLVVLRCRRATLPQTPACHCTRSDNSGSETRLRCNTSAQSGIHTTNPQQSILNLRHP